MRILETFSIFHQVYCAGPQLKVLSKQIARSCGVLAIFVPLIIELAHLLMGCRCACVRGSSALSSPGLAELAT